MKPLVSVAEGADLLSTSVGYEEPAANVAEFYGIPLVALHTMPWRPNGQLFPVLPPMLTRTGMTAYDWLTWRVTKGPKMPNDDISDCHRRPARRRSV